MDASSTHRLNPAAPPFSYLASAPSQLCSPASSPLTVDCLLPPQCLYPPPSLPPSCGVAVPPLLWVHVPPPPPCPVTVDFRPPPLPAPRCSVTEIVDDGSDKPPKAEVGDGPSPRSVLAPLRKPRSASRRAPKRRAALPPPSSRIVGSKPAFDPSSSKTSLMICNIPNNFLKRRIMDILDHHCAEENDKLRWRVGGDGKVVKSEYDFLYVPIDFGTKFNKGYAFVNMTTVTAAHRLHAVLHGHSWAATGSPKVCEVVHANIQGVDALAAYFSGSEFPCGNGNEEFLPVRFGPPRNGLWPTAERVIGRAVVRRPS